jgi:enoyl-CoA hydratase
MTEKEVVHVELVDHVLTITMDRPEARNALNYQMMSELAAAFERLDNELDCWVGVLQGEGPAFCVGADLKEALQARANHEEPTRPPNAASIFRPHRKPLIGCVEGYAFAGGLEILMTCDLVVATTEATFALSEVKRGLLAIGGGLFRLPRRLPTNIAKELIITGAAMPAAVLHQYGLINRLTQPGDARSAARDLATVIAANSPVAVQAALAVVGSSVAEGWTDDQGWAGQKGPSQRVLASEDLLEGLRAFSEKRAPNWSGR